jgi:ATP-dependent protease ClpP protease subunit
VNTAYISFHAHINPVTTQNLLGAIFDRMGKGFDHLYFLFSSPGGQVNSGMTLYNTIKSLPVHTTMHNMGNVDSIGNAIFLAGKERFSCPHSTFMFHGVGFDVSNARLERKVLEERLDGLNADEGRIAKVIGDETTLEAEEIKDLFVQATTKDVDFAITNGLISDVKLAEVPSGADVVQLVFNT